MKNLSLTNEQLAIFEENIGLIYKYVKMRIPNKLMSNRNKIDEIISELRLALCKAVKGFDTSKGYRFTTYAFASFRNAHHDYVRKLVRLEKKYPVINVDDEIIVENKELINRIDWLRVTQVLKQLDISERDRNITIHYLTNEFSLTATGIKYNLSKERIRQICNEVMGKFKVFMLSNGFLLEDLCVHTNMFWDEVPDREKQLA